MKTKSKILNRFANMKIAALAALAVAALASTPALAGDNENDNDGDDFKFDLVPSKGLPTAALNGALKNAHGQVKIESVGPVEIMDVTVWGLPPNTDFDFFVIQVPNKPFGLAWYQGDIETNKVRKGLRQVHRPFQHRDLHCFAGQCSGSCRVPQGVSGCCAGSRDWTDPYLPPGPVVQFPDGRSEGQAPQAPPHSMGRATRVSKSSIPAIFRISLDR